MEETLAVLIDFENIAAGTEKDGLGRFDVEAVLARVKDKGRVLVARSYADWGRFARFKQELLRANVTMYELTSHGMQDKNRADIAMVVDCLELALTRDYISTYVIVSGDSDFTPLAQKLREHNKRVIGCGCRSSTSRLLIEACDEFFFYDGLVQQQRGRRQSTRTRRRDNRMTREAAYELAAEAVQGLQRENPDPPLASVVKGAMLRKSPDFSESDLKFSSFARFLEAAQDAGFIKVIRDTKSGGYRVDLVEGEAPEPVRERSEDSKAPAGETVEGAYVDEYTPEGALEIVKVLAARGMDPMSAPTRLTVLETIDAIVSDRRKRRRRVTAKFVQEDVRKRLRRTRPELPKQSVHALFDALLKADVLIHKDGTPIRTFQAPFTLNKDAAKINELLMGVYLGELREADVDLPDSTVLAELFLGNADRSREVEEALAWLAAPPVKSDDDDDDAQGPQGTKDIDLDLDDLLVFEETEEQPAKNAPAASDLDAILEVGGDDDDGDVLILEEEPAPKKRKRTRKKKPAAETVEETSADEEAPVAQPAAETNEAPAEEPKVEEPKAVEPAEEPKADEPAEAAATDASADGSEEAPAEEEKPKRAPRRRRTTKKKTEEEG